MKRITKSLMGLLLSLFMFVSSGLLVSANTPNVIRHEGYSRENVAENVAKKHFSNANKVIIVNRDKFPDAISATNISQGKYPVLYTHAHTVSDSTLEFLKTMDLDEVYILGGKLSVNESVVSKLDSELGVEVTRVAGRSRYDANVAAIEKNFDKANHVVIASGEVYADALYGVSYANTINAPVVLTKTNNLEASTVELLKGLGVRKVTIIGGTLTVTNKVEQQLEGLGISHERIAGRNRYIGSAEVASASYPNPNNLVVASGEGFADALVSAPIAQKFNAPIILVKSESMESVVETYITESKSQLKNVYIQGGKLTISENMFYTISDLAETVITTTQVVEKEDIPYEVERRPNPDLYVGKEKVYQKGELGIRETHIEITYQDGEEIDRKEISTKVTKDPIKEIIEFGTKELGVSERVDVILSRSKEDAYLYAIEEKWDDYFDEYELIDFTSEELEALNNSVDVELLNEEFRKIINNHRESLGRQPLVYTSRYYPQTEQLANEFADYGHIRIEGYPPHTRPNGKPTHSLFENLNDWMLWGENLAMEVYFYNPYKSISEKYLAERFFDMWYNSSGHRENMEHPDFNEFTLAIKTGHIEPYGQAVIAVKILTQGY